MRIIVVGIGKLGSYLAKTLVKERHDVTVIDVNFINHEDLINNEDLNYIEGNALDPSILIEAGAKDADLLISVMNKDEQNIMCSLIAKKLGTKHTIARIRTPEYNSAINILKEELGLSITVNPEKLTAEYIARALNIPSALNATTFFRGRIHMISLKVSQNTVLCGTTVNELGRKLKRIIICAIERNNEIIIPDGTTKIVENDKIYVSGTQKEINNFLRYTKLITHKTKKVIISGATETAFYLAKILLEIGMEVKLIDLDEERCKYLSEKLPGALIINGDVSNKSLLYEEGIDECDAFVSLNSIDEKNIIYSMFASSINIPKIITKINHITLDEVIKNANIDNIVAPHKIAINQIVKYVRAMENSGSSSCEAIYKFNNESFEMVEFNVKNDFKKLNIKIKELNLKQGILIAVILREKNIIIPSGDDYIKNGDIIVIADNNDEIRNINDILE